MTDVTKNYERVKAEDVEIGDTIARARTNAGKITKVPLYGTRGARRGSGYRMPTTTTDARRRA